MTSTAALLVVFMAAPESGAEWARALEAVLRQAVDPKVTVALRAGREGGDSALLAEAEEWVAKGEAVAVVEVRGPDRSAVVLRLQTPTEPGWQVRSLSFKPEDPERERGRAAGFTLAAMLPSGYAAPKPAAAGPEESRLAPLRPVVAVAARSEPSRWSAAAAVQGTLAVGSPGNRVGVSVSARWTAQEPVDFQAVGALGVGALPLTGAEEARLSELFIGVGAALVPWRSAPGRPMGLAFSLDLGAQALTVTREEPAETLARWLPALRVRAEGSVRVWKGLELAAGIGATAALEDTRVMVAGQAAAWMSRVSPFLELGAHWRF